MIDRQRLRIGPVLCPANLRFGAEQLRLLSIVAVRDRVMMLWIKEDPAVEKRRLLESKVFE